MIDSPNSYNSHPCYPVVGGSLATGWAEICQHAAGMASLAVDGPAIAPWDQLRETLRRQFRSLGRTAAFVATWDHFLPWDEILALTTTDTLADDPDFEVLADMGIERLMRHPVGVDQSHDADLVVVYGPGAAAWRADLLWYFDLPKRYAEAAVTSGHGRNLGQRADETSPPSTKRLFYTDWPILDRHRDAIADRVDLWLDAQHVTEGLGIDAEVLGKSLVELAARPFRTLPTFNSTSWGGQWGRRRLGMGTDQHNTALGYELIAPESGILIGPEPARAVEIPFQLLVGRHPVAVLGQTVAAAFGTSFPIRFDYLDTVDGGNLSVHCHPQDSYMRTVFGWAYPQQETYYMMVAGQDSKVFLGLKDGRRVADFHAAAHAAHHDEQPFDITEFVHAFPATQHQLYLVPTGTPHGSGEGNVVLEVSATPYLYSLRFYDWLRRDRDGNQRAVHVDHAFRNLDTARTGARVAEELIPAPRTLRTGPSWKEEVLGDLDEMFFEVRRVTLDAGAVYPDSTAGRFLILNVVSGHGIEFVTETGSITLLNYAETLVVPAQVGVFQLRTVGTDSARVVKALVK